MTPEAFANFIKAETSKWAPGSSARKNRRRLTRATLRDLAEPCNRRRIDSKTFGAIDINLLSGGSGRASHLDHSRAGGSPCVFNCRRTDGGISVVTERKPPPKRGCLAYFAVVGGSGTLQPC
jgi:hypothetical protein